jgi:ribosomal protein S18 acetylase RimI-like enzyme
MKISLRKAILHDADLTFNIEQFSIKEYANSFYATEKKTYKNEFNYADIQIIELETENNYDSKAIGYLEIDEKNHSFEIINILIHKDFQNQGFGKLLLAEIIKEAQTKSKGIELQVLKNNPKAKRFYENAGFQVYFETEFEFKMKFSHANKLFRNQMD